MTEHLSPETFVDLLDGTIAESSVPHLAACERCAARLTELQAMTVAVDVEVPEPSPLFWDHLSARVREAVAEERVAPAAAWWRQVWSWRAISMASAAVAVVAVLVGLQMPRVGRAAARGAVDAPPPRVSRTADVASPAVVSPERLAADDEPLGFVADLASELDWDGASAAGFATSESADRVLDDMTDTERVELRRLLSEALGATGA
jgi:hypothetical protein